MGSRGKEGKERGQKRAEGVTSGESALVSHRHAQTSIARGNFIIPLRSVAEQYSSLFDTLAYAVDALPLTDDFRPPDELVVRPARTCQDPRGPADNFAQPPVRTAGPDLYYRKHNDATGCQSRFVNNS